MKIFLRKDIEKVGMAGEIVKVEDGYARNFLIPRKLAVEVTNNNESFYKNNLHTIEHRKEVVATATSMLAERIKSLKLTIKRKMHDDGELYGAVRASEIVELLAEKGISIAKNQVKFDKTIKKKGIYTITIMLTSRLQPTVQVTVASE